jgi:type VI secretion system secreted protein VgrG
MALSEHPRAEWNDLWLLLEIVHEGKQPQVLGENITSDVTQNKDDFHQGYRNRFLATPWDAHYRPALEKPKPKVLGSQTAIVTGPPGEEIHCDEYGRVKVQFFWDREDQSDDKTSCWLRVATGWAGNAYTPSATGMKTSNTTRKFVSAMNGMTRSRPTCSANSRSKSIALRIWIARPKRGRMITSLSA